MYFIFEWTERTSLRIVELLHNKKTIKMVVNIYNIMSENG